MGKWWTAEPHLQSVGSTPALKGFITSGEESPSNGGHKTLYATSRNATLNLGLCYRQCYCYGWFCSTPECAGGPVCA